MKSYFLLLVCLCFYPAFAQNPDEDNVEVTQEADTSAVLYSECVLRLGYSSKTLSAGRDFGINQYAFTPSFTYYHKSGVYAGVSGSWYSQTDPNYNLTTLSVGYDGSSKDMNWGYTVSYDRLIFNPDETGLIKNVASLYGSRNWLHFNVGASYSFLFSGDEQAHRLNPMIGGYFTIKPRQTQKWLEKISFAPTISATFGTSNVPLSQLSGSQFSTGTGLTWEEAKELRLEYKEKYPDLYRKYVIYRRTHSGKDVDFVTFAAQRGVIVDVSTATPARTFGLMCWTFSVPVSFKFHRLKAGVAYNYVIPRLLPDEVYTSLPSQSYFSASLTYTLSKGH